MRPVHNKDRGLLRGQKLADQGFTLIEVLFSLLFLSAGLLGIAALEDIALARNVDARRLSAATNMATEMLERIRFNSPANSTALAGAAIPAVPYLYHGIVACSSAVGAACSGSSSLASEGNTANPPGTPANLTAWGDYNQWRVRIAQVDSNGVPLLPNGIGTVTSAVVAPGAGPSLNQIQVTVTVGWTSGLRTPTVVMSTFVAPL